MSTPTDIDPANLDKLIEQAENRLISEEEDSTEYATTLAVLERLYKIRKSITPEPQPVPDETKDKVRFKDWLPIIATIGGTLIIVTAEAFGHTLTSKAWQDRKQLK